MARPKVVSGRCLEKRCSGVCRHGGDDPLRWVEARCGTWRGMLKVGGDCLLKSTYLKNKNSYVTTAVTQAY